MPYLKKEDRSTLFQPRTAGQLNYDIHLLLEEFFDYKGFSYSSINEAIGALECAKLEVYRRLAGPYEDKKKEENGDVALYESFGGK